MKDFKDSGKRNVHNKDPRTIAKTLVNDLTKFQNR